jgi:hypothetical protein
MEENLEVERLFPFVRRARKFMIGREVVYRNRHRLQFVLITEDLADNSKKEILESFRHYPIVQHYKTSDIEKFLGAQHTKVIGFVKSSLATSIYRGLKEWRINPTGPKNETQKSGPS